MYVVVARSWLDLGYFFLSFFFFLRNPTAPFRFVYLFTSTFISSVYFDDDEDRTYLTVNNNNIPYI